MHHGAALARLSHQPALPKAVAFGTWGEVPERMAALLRYSVKLTLEPWTMKEEDVEKLRSAGLSDRDIVDANQIVCYYAYANRLTDGLGVQLEDTWPEEIRAKRGYPIRDDPTLWR